MNAIMEDMLRHYVSVDQDDWDQHLDMAEFAVNSAVQETTKMSPLELKNGYSSFTPKSLGVSAGQSLPLIDSDNLLNILHVTTCIPPP